jgi:hypothetical protein
MFKSKQEAAGYLSGLIDGEGSVRVGSEPGASITIWNTDLGILDAAQEALRLLGSSGKLYQRQKPRGLSKKDSYYVKVGRREQIEPLLPWIKLHGEKARKVEEIEDYYAEWKKRPRHHWPLAEVRQYFDAKRGTQREAAEHFGVALSTIQRWKLAAYGREPRPERSV